MPADAIEPTGSRRRKGWVRSTRWLSAASVFAVGVVVQDVILPWVEARSGFPERTSVHGGAQESAQQWVLFLSRQGHEPTVLNALPARFVL